jgi:hypothetical protein
VTDDPSQLDPYKRLWDELVLLRDAWYQHEVLYRSSPEVRHLLDRSARWFFRSHERFLLREVILAIARLTDSEGVRGKRNLVLRSLLSHPTIAQNQELSRRLAGSVSAIEEEAAPLRLHRHKYIAHLDHAVATGETTSPLPPISFESVLSILQRSEALYQEFSLVAYESDVAFDLSALGHAPALLERLTKADKWAQLVQSILQSEFTRPNDVNPTA